MNRIYTGASCAEEQPPGAVDGADEKQLRQTMSQRCPWDDWHPITDFDSSMADALAKLPSSP